MSMALDEWPEKDGHEMRWLAPVGLIPEEGGSVSPPLHRNLCAGKTVKIPSSELKYCHLIPGLDFRLSARTGGVGKKKYNHQIHRCTRHCASGICFA